MLIPAMLDGHFHCYNMHYSEELSSGGVEMIKYHDIGLNMSTMICVIPQF